MVQSDVSIEGNSAEDGDVSGRKRLAKNLLARWLGQLVVVVSGFVIPRLIDNSLGSTSLGIWDLGWSTVSYFRFLGLGLAGSLNRYVALYSARRDIDQLRRAVSSTAVLQLGFSVLTLAASFLAAYIAPQLFPNISESEAAACQVLIALLGGSLAIRMLFWPARSILTGLHLWTVSTAVSAMGDILVLIGIVTALSLGGGLPALGLIVILTAAVTEFVRSILAGRAHSAKLLELASVDTKMMKKMFIFGVKNNITVAPVVIIIQTTSILLAATAGPAVLALYARPLALFRIIQKLLSNYAILLTSTSGSLQGLGRDDEIREFFLTSLRSSVAMALPPIIALGVYGDLIVGAWMGQSYVVPYLAPVLSAGFFLPFSQSAAMRIVVGLNAHGRLGLLSLLVCLATFSICLILAFFVGWSPIAAALIVGVSLSSGPGIVVPIGACRRLNIGLTEYLRAVFLVPLLCNLVLLVLLALPRWMRDDVTLAQAMGWSVVCFCLLAPVYWRHIFSSDLRAQILGWLRKFRMSERG